MKHIKIFLYEKNGMWDWDWDSTMNMIILELKKVMYVLLDNFLCVWFALIAKKWKVREWSTIIITKQWLKFSTFDNWDLHSYTKAIK